MTKTIFVWDWGFGHGRSFVIWGFSTRGGHLCPCRQAPEQGRNDEQQERETRPRRANQFFEAEGAAADGEVNDADQRKKGDSFFQEALASPRKGSG